MTTTSTISQPPAPSLPAATAARRPTPRKIRVYTFDDWMSLTGSLLSSFVLVDIVYEHLLDGSGTLGFLVVWYLAFLMLYAAVVGLSNSRPFV
ncbi:MAG: hypothetical protein JO246_16560, partial [Frankiaceae bacterium]|nr:hypothetical protein [Frankiaceae bacterium]